MSLQRFTDTSACTVPASTSLVGSGPYTYTTTPGINFGSSSAGQVRVPTGSSISSLTWYCGDSINGPWYPCNSAPVTTISAGQSDLIPAACFGAHWLLPVGNAAGSINLDLKS
jgi:hypothetical protein